MEQRGTQIFVQLGRTPDYVPHFVNQAAMMLPEYRTVLITDRRDRHSPESYETVDFKLVVSRSEVEALLPALTRAGYDPKFRRGYWLKVFLRFVAIRNYLGLTRYPGPALHLECDVASFLSAPLLENAMAANSAAALIPMIDDSTACRPRCPSVGRRPRDV